MRYLDIPKFISDGHYTASTELWDIERQLDSMRSRCLPGTNKEVYDGLDLDPDFQRGHVWTEAQQVAFMEYFLREGRSGRDIYFNNPTWMTTFSEPTVLVDGKQRLTAARRFMANQIKVFGLFAWEFEGKARMTFNFHVNSLKTRKEVLQWYLQMNAGGTPHTAEELERVRVLLANER